MAPTYLTHEQGIRRHGKRPDRPALVRFDNLARGRGSFPHQWSDSFPADEHLGGDAQVPVQGADHAQAQGALAAQNL